MRGNLVVLLRHAGMALVCVLLRAPSAHADTDLINRGRYLVALGGCEDCHTPGNFLGKRDTSRTLGGSEVGFEIPKLGVFYGPNLTPDEETGLGLWTDAQVSTAFRTGKRPDGRTLSPTMPWENLKTVTDADAQAIVAYLRSLQPVTNKVPGPFGPDQTPTSFVMKVVPPTTK